MASDMDSSASDTGSDGHVRGLSAVLQDLSERILSVKRPADFIAVLSYGVPFFASIRIAIECGVFQHLAAEAGKALTAIQIAEHIRSKAETDGPQAGTKDVDEDLIQRRDFVVRNLRILCGIGLVDEVGPYVYQPNEITLALADPGLSAAISQMYHGVMGPRSTMLQMVGYAKENGWKAPPTALDGPYQRAHEIVGMSTFEHWVKCDPEQMSRLNATMLAHQKHYFQHWLEWFPKEALFGQQQSNGHTDPNSDGVFFVDVGGSYGHDISALATKYPKDAGRMILQDLPGVLDEGVDTRGKAGEVLDPRIELMPYDFFEPQPVKGAQIYFMHKIMHDWPDSDCAKILVQLRDAMAAYSRIFINDCILPAQGCPLRPAVADLAMLALHSGKERDEEMWTRLISKVDGLTIRKFWHGPDLNGEGIVEIVRSTN